MKNLLSELFDREGVTIDEMDLFAREVLQKIILNGLSRGQFFKRAAFHGGTALRILHSLGRYSEDLDFKLFERDPDFKLERYLSYVVSEAESYGLTVRSKVREGGLSNISTGDIRCNERELVMEIGFPNEWVKSLGRDTVVRVKIDVDTDPSYGAKYEKYSMKYPLNYYLCVLDLPSMFAGKLGAVLTRRWGMREKGRDFYDYLWYVENEIPINMEYMRANLERAKVLSPDDEFNIDVLRDMLRKRFESADYASILSDVEKFIIGQKPPSHWGPETFIVTLPNLKVQ